MSARKRVLPFGILVAALIAPLGVASAAPPSDWSKIPTKTVKLFYPGQAGFDWTRSPDHKRAQREVLNGQACTSCHEGEEADLGKVNVVKSRLEPTPIKDKIPTIDLGVQAAHDAENVYLRFQWKTQLNRQGNMHDYVRFDGKDWKKYGDNRTAKDVVAGTQPPLYEDRLAVMLDDGKVPVFAEQGCWLTCHNGMRDMPGDAAGEKTTSHPRLGTAGMKQSDVRKYLPATRTDPAASWDKLKSPEEIAALKAKGEFVELWQWRAHRSAPVDMADDGYVLEYRLADAGKNPFGSNMDGATKMPRFMFDAGKVGAKSLTAADLANPAKAKALIKEANAVAFDPNAGWKEGDILPGQLLSKADSTGSASDNKTVHGEWKDGTYTVVWTRKLNTGNAADDKILKVGGKYTVGLAVHDDNVTTRFHHVSFPLTLGIGADADIKAVTQN